MTIDDVGIDELAAQLPPFMAVPRDTAHPATRRSFHLLTPGDGRIAVDLWLPPRRDGELVPAALRTTRYWRATVGDRLGELRTDAEVARWTNQGFALVLADARGSGASFGTWPRPWTDDERDDVVAVVDWIVSEPWSNGAVGGFGTSYDGSTTHLLASTGHPAVKAVVPRFALFDPYHHIGFPGGVPLDWFLAVWSAGNWTLDGHPGRAHLRFPPLPGDVRPVDDDADGSLLDAARAEHAGNWDMWATVQTARSRGDLVGADGERVETGTPLGRIAELRKTRVPMWVWSSWYDGAYSAAALAQLADAELDCRVTIGPWSHGAGLTVLGSPFAPEAPIDLDLPAQTALMAGFLTHYTSDRPGAADEFSPLRLRYYTIGEEAWHESDAWPPAGIAPERWWLAGDGSATSGEPDAATVDYAVDFRASSGRSTRWHTLMGGVFVAYGDRRDAVGRRCSWVLPVVDRDVELTGTPAVSLVVSSTAEDAAVFVYLEDEAPDGTRTYLTEGQLRAWHRRAGVGSPPYETYGPWHSFEEADAQLLVPGEPARLDFTLWPISALVRAGHRLRIEIAGADAGLFRRVPDTGDAMLTFHLGPAGSTIDLPLRPR
ncbi:MAG: CocE/NonD family hydrolase [Acidimicrobiales bacterium]